MFQNIRFFIAQTICNLKNAYALKSSFWTGVIMMMASDLSFFIIWLLFMKATGPINGWTSLDVFGMIGISMLIYGISNSFFRGIVDLPQMVFKGTFDSVLLSPSNSFVKLSSSSFLTTAYGDLFEGLAVTICYILLKGLSLQELIPFIIAIVFGVIIFVSVRLIASLAAFYIHDSDGIAEQVFDIFLRPTLYPGAIFPDKLKLVFMTVIPALLTSAAPIDIIKDNNLSILLLSGVVTLIWVALAYFGYSRAARRYESGNLLR